MQNRLVKLSLQPVFILVMSIVTCQAFAGWSDAGPYGVYQKKKYGEFPPLDIDEQLQDGMNRREDTLQQEMMDEERTESKQIQKSSAPPKGSFYQTNTPAQVTPAPGQQPAQPYQQPAVNAANNVPATSAAPVTDSQNTTTGEKKKKKKKKKKNSGFDFPWGNNNSGFSFPWNDGGSGFHAPWNNRRSSYNRPWENNRRYSPWNNDRSGFGAPWDNNRSGFSAPWDNDHSGFSFGPFGSDRHRR